MPGAGRNGSRRFYAIKAIENPAMVPEEHAPTTAAAIAAACSADHAIFTSANALNPSPMSGTIWP